MLIYNPKVATDMNLVTYGRFLRFASGQYTKVDLDNLTLTWLFVYVLHQNLPTFLMAFMWIKCSLHQVAEYLYKKLKVDISYCNYTLINNIN